jgi:hypothetical protein
MKRITGNLRIVVVAVVVALVGGGTAYAAGAINGHSIKNNSIPLNKLTAAAKAQLKGQAGATGAQGAKGDQGPKGDTGARGLQGEPGKDGTNGADGIDGTNGINGKDGVDGARGPAGPTEHNYGVSALFVDGQKVATSWTATIPMDGNNAATSSGSTVVNCAAACTLSVRGAIRSDVAGFAGQAGAGLVVTNAMNGQLVAAGQTPANDAYNGVAVVNVGSVGLGSGEPSSLTDGTDIPLTWAFGSAELPAGLYTVQGTTEYFDFPSN